MKTSLSSRLCAAVFPLISKILSVAFVPGLLVSGLFAPALLVSCSKLPANPAWHPDLPDVPFRVTVKELRAGGRRMLLWTLTETEPGVWQMQSTDPQAGELVCTEAHSIELRVEAERPEDAALLQGVNLYVADVQCIRPVPLEGDGCRFRLEYGRDTPPEGIQLLLSTEASLEAALAAPAGDGRTRSFRLAARREVPLEWLKFSYENASLGEYKEYVLQRNAALTLTVYYQHGVSRVRMLTLLDYGPHHATDDLLWYGDDGVWTRLQLQAQGGVLYQPKLTDGSWFTPGESYFLPQLTGRRIWVSYGDYVPNQFMLYSKVGDAVTARFTLRTIGVRL